MPTQTPLDLEMKTENKEVKTIINVLIKDF